MSFHRKPTVPVEFYGPLIALDRSSLIELIYDLLMQSPYFDEASLVDDPKAGARQVYLLHACSTPEEHRKPMPKNLRDVLTPNELDKEDRARNRVDRERA